MTGSGELQVASLDSVTEIDNAKTEKKEGRSVGIQDFVSSDTLSERKLVLVPGQEGHGAVRDAVETALRPVLTWDASNKAVAAWARARNKQLVVLNAARRFRNSREILEVISTQDAERRLSVQQSLDPVITKLTSDLEEAATRGDGSVVEITDDMLSVLCNKKDINVYRAIGGVAAVTNALGVTETTGVSSTDVERRRARFGPNTFPEKPPKGYLDFVWDAFQDTTLITLIVAAGLSLLAGMIDSVEDGWHDGVSIIFAIAIVVNTSAYNDYNQSKQFRDLNKDKKNLQISVVRDSKRTKVSIHDLVVGDIVVLSLGDQVPADGLLISGMSVMIDEASMTGEPEPIKKIPHEKPFLQSGTKVMEGFGTMVVTATGLNTEWGRIMAVTSEDNDEQTPLQERLDSVASGIGKAGMVIAVIMFIALLVRGLISGAGHWYKHLIDAFIVGITIVVVAVPEGLPLAVTITLAYSMKKMARDKALVRHLGACEAMGGATTICSDKTGTLTTNKMTVVRAWVAGTLHEERPSAKDIPDAVSQPLVRACLLNSTGAVSRRDDGSGEHDISGSPTEQAILGFGASLADFDAVKSGVETLKIEPFNSAKKRMGVLVRDRETGRLFVFWKGASEIVLGACTRVLSADGTSSALDADTRTRLESHISDFADAALRTLFLAFRELPPVAGTGAENPAEAELPFGELTAIALVGIKDPCRPGVPEAVLKCQAAGIIVRMVTGDNVQTARAIARECNIFHDGDVALEGPVFREMPREEIIPLLPRLRILARSSPTDKHTLVSLLRSLGDVVAVTGDGTNDAPALHEADVGLAMGIAGTEVAKEASDIIILDDNFCSVVRVVRWGRSVYRNIQSFVAFQFTVNLTALAINVITALAGGDVPLTAVQLLWVNLIMDTMGALALATEAPRESLMQRKPYGRTEPIISNEMWRNLLAQAVYQLIVLCLLYFGGCEILGFGMAREIWAPILPSPAPPPAPPGVPHNHATAFASPPPAPPQSPYPPPYPPPGTPPPMRFVGFDMSKGCPPERFPDSGHILNAGQKLRFHDWNVLTTFIFNSFVWMQVFNELSARNTEDLNVFRHVTTNRIFLGIIAFTTVVQVLIVEFAGFFAQTTPLSYELWLASILIGVTTMPLALFFKAFVPVPETPNLTDFLTPDCWVRRSLRSNKVKDEEAGEAPADGDDTARNAGGGR